jgi:HD-like signal output (HDOD) protein
LLKSTISRVCALRDLIDNELLRQLVAELKVVPSLPTLYQQLMTELEAPEPSLKKVNDLIEQDLGLTTKLLQIVNSPFFGVRRAVTSAREAVLLLGLETISALALGVGIFDQFQHAPQQKLLEQLWTQSLQIAERAQWLAMSEVPDYASPAFTAGVLHALGRILMAVNLPHEYAEMQALQEREQLAPAVAETRLFGTTSAAVGAYLLGLWGLPVSVVDAVGYQDIRTVILLPPLPP